ncbi:MAG: sulfatase-like hydrolase/transferase [Burkholderiales bacterium]|nr:sulfatase-like hydrolase/transferase [Burkholderiales bacterium]
MPQPPPGIAATPARYRQVEAALTTLLPPAASDRPARPRAASPENIELKPQNLLFILSDEHNKKITGAYGHPMIKTPNLDRLAARGTRFTSAYTNCPICVPARAALATGRYVHEVRCWDNAIAYQGHPAAWGHRLMARGHRAVSIGKLHYTRNTPAENGFDEEILPLHIVDGLGDLLGLIRDELPVRIGSRKLGPEAARGESEYTAYDRAITAAAVRWIREQTGRQRDKPWALYVGYVAPHFPLVAPPEFFDLYPEDAVPWPSRYAPEERPRHPFLDAMRNCMQYDVGFTDAAMVRRAITAYFGLVSFLDHNIGQVLAALEEAGLMQETRVVYSSDHGDNLGARGMWGKSTMFEESAGIPLIVAGEGVPASAVSDVPVTLVDLFPTILQGVGVAPHAEDADLPGQSLFEIANGRARERVVLSEYHAAAAIAATYMIRHGCYKYVHYVGMPPMLFDLTADPDERDDRGSDPAYAGIVAECEAKLRSVVDPEAADRLARADQEAKIAAVGGREAIHARGTFRYSPPPGSKPVMFT